MTIEFLWIIPVLALALFVPFVLIATKRNNISTSDKLLRQEVELYNEGIAHVKQPANVQENRISSIEKTIDVVSTVLSDQQKIIEGFKGHDAGVDATLNNLKDKLRELQREYDIVISENYSLRARVRQLTESKSEDIESDKDKVFVKSKDVSSSKPQKNVNLYEDTRSFRISDLEDTSEVDISSIS